MCDRIEVKKFGGMINFVGRPSIIDKNQMIRLSESGCGVLEARKDVYIYRPWSYLHLLSLISYFLKADSDISSYRRSSYVP